MTLEYKKFITYFFYFPATCNLITSRKRFFFLQAVLFSVVDFITFIAQFTFIFGFTKLVMSIAQYVFRMYIKRLSIYVLTIFL